MNSIVPEPTKPGNNDGAYAHASEDTLSDDFASVHGKLELLIKFLKKNLWRIVLLTIAKFLFSAFIYGLAVA